eukprot:4304988-Pyramimonas_sp.AAC.1
MFSVFREMLPEALSFDFEHFWACKKLYEVLAVIRLTVYRRRQFLQNCSAQQWPRNYQGQY